jgi:hypothetical protein
VIAQATRLHKRSRADPAGPQSGMQDGLLCTPSSGIAERSQGMQIGGSRAMAVTSGRYGARLAFQSVGEPSADYDRRRHCVGTAHMRALNSWFCAPGVAEWTTLLATEERALPQREIAWIATSLCPWHDSLLHMAGTLRQICCSEHGKGLSGHNHADVPLRISSCHVRCTSYRVTLAWFSGRILTLQLFTKMSDHLTFWLEGWQHLCYVLR